MDGFSEKQKRVSRNSIFASIKRLHRPVFTTFESILLSGKSSSATTQALNLLQRDGLVFKIYRGIWAEVGNKELSPYAVIPFLFPTHRVYLSFISALHLYGIIEQIPQVITLASTAHTKIIRTKIADFSVHRIAPSFFNGFDWYQETGSFLIADAEKALVDSLYLSACRKKQFRHFPELHFSKSFNFNKAGRWAGKISNVRIRSYVQKRLNAMRE
ncbi:MAG: hypothetical protein ABIK20_00805 [Candidatus Omnitrophota bacterium]